MNHIHGPTDPKSILQAAKESPFQGKRSKNRTSTVRQTTHPSNTLPNTELPFTLTAPTRSSRYDFLRGPRSVVALMTTL